VWNGAAAAIGRDVRYGAQRERGVLDHRGKRQQPDEATISVPMTPEARQPNEASLPRQFVDERFPFRGYSDRQPIGVCRVRIYERMNESPVIVLTELEENETTSITNLAENLWPEVLAKYLPHRFDYPEPAICIEHYPTIRSPRGRIERDATYDQVTFARWQPRAVRRQGIKRIELGEPDWHPLPREKLHQLIGEPEN